VPVKSIATPLAYALACCALVSGCRSEVSGWVLSERAGVALPGSDGAPSDAGCSNCPVSILWTNPSSTPQFGLPEGTPFDDACPDDQAIIGFRGSVQDVGVFLVSSIRTFCGRLVVPNATATDVSILAGATLQERGTPSGQTWAQMCPRDQMVVGFWGRSGRSLDQVGFDCAGVRVSRNPPGDYVLAVDTTISELSPPNGGDGGMPFRVRCSSGQIALTANINADVWVNAFGLTCATPVTISGGGDP
jgi:hypothetical protein